MSISGWGSLDLIDSKKQEIQIKTKKFKYMSPIAKGSIKIIDSIEMFMVISKKEEKLSR